MWFRYLLTEHILFKTDLGLQHGLLALQLFGSQLQLIPQILQL